MFGGRGGCGPSRAARKSASSPWSAGLKRRSKPIVVDAFELIAAPQSEPATWPGKTSTPSPSSASRRRLWKRPSAPSCASTARSGRPASPTKSESPVRTSHGSSPRERSITAKQQCSGRWPGVWIVRRTTSPTSTSVPSSSGSCGKVAPASRVDADRDAVLEREPSVPGDVVGVRVRLEDADEPDARGAPPPPAPARRRTAGRRRPRRPRARRRRGSEAQPRSSFRNCLNSTARRYHRPPLCIRKRLPGCGDLLARAPRRAAAGRTSRSRGGRRASARRS